MNAEKADALAPFQRVSNLRGALDLLLVYSLIFGIVTAVSHANNAILILLVLPVMGGLQNWLMSLQHDAWHHLCFRPPRLNNLICSWLTAYVVGSAYYFNLVRHSGHHAYFGTEKDPDWETFINKGRETPVLVLRHFLFILCGGAVVDHIKGGLNNGKTLPGMDIRPQYMPSRRREFIAILVAQFVLMGLFALTGAWWHYWLYWALPLVTFGAFFTMTRQFIEHAHPDDRAQPEQRLNEFDSNPVEQFFFGPAHFHYHSFHHAYPRIPHYNLTRARALARQNGITYPGRVRTGYVAAFVEHMQALKTLPVQVETNT